MPGLLATCNALLGLSSVQLLYATNIEAVLLRLALHSGDGAGDDTTHAE